MINRHIFVAGRCIWCGVSALDAYLYEDVDECADRDEVLVYRSETGHESEDLYSCEEIPDDLDLGAPLFDESQA